MMRRIAALALVAAATTTFGQGVPGPRGGRDNLVIVPGEAPRMEKGAFLGLTASPPNATLRDQLKLPRGTGLVVDFVEKDSPADAAGLKPHDILTKLDDQLLVNFQQLAVLVRLHKTDDTIKLTFVRQGDTKVADAKLIEKDVPAMRDDSPWMTPMPPGHGALPPGMFETLPQGDAWRSASRVNIQTGADGNSVRTLKVGGRTLTLTVTKDGQKTLAITERSKDLPSGNEADKDVFSGPVNTEDQRKALPPGAEDQLRRLEGHRMPEMNLKDGENVGVSAPKGATVSVSSGDTEHTLQLNVDATGGKHLEVKDASGLVLFDGPINTPDDRAKVPPAALKKLEKLESSIKWK